ncbi:MAG: hypothetical protein U0350_39450 [Caldilineaceae bacterium]
MKHTLLYWLRIIIPLLLLILAYHLLIQGTFLWLSVCILFALNALGIYLLRLRVLLNRPHAFTIQSAFTKVQFELLKAMATGILVLMLYDYFVRHTLRWETYTAMLTAQLILLLLGFGLSRRTT